MSDLSLDTGMQREIAIAVKVLSEGGVAAIPTDTLYGLAANAFDESAVQKVYELKGRPDGMALPLLLSDAADASRCADHLSDSALALAERFWPGALTLVVRKSADVPRIVTAGMDTVALRVPDHPVPRAIAKSLGSPITGTSANMSGMPGLTNAPSVRAEFGDTLDFVLDGGDAIGGVASTVLDVTGSKPRVLREGAVSWVDIKAALKNTE